MSTDSCSRSSHEDLVTFDLVPVSLWVEDFSGLKMLLSRWAANGMVDLEDYLHGDPERLRECLRAIRIIKVNSKTLSLYEASSFEHLVEHLPRIIGSGAMGIEAISSLWKHQGGFFSETVNHTVTGRRLNLYIRGTILPGHDEDWGRVLLSAEDITALHDARALARHGEEYARALFEHSPVALWVIDCSAAKKAVDTIYMEHSDNAKSFLGKNEDVIGRTLESMHIIDVNFQTMKLYGAVDKEAFLKLDYKKTRSKGLDGLVELFLSLLLEQSPQEREVTRTRLDGSEIQVHQKLVVLPGYEQTWERVQVAELDITARKIAEERIRYLQDHDILTSLHSRLFFKEESARFAAEETYPISVTIADLNGLKDVNDLYGHGRGDDLLRQAADVFREVVSSPWSVSRIGGDEFAILMPGAKQEDCFDFMRRVQNSVSSRNRNASGQPLSLSLGSATRRKDESLATTISRADAEMYKEKQKYYDHTGFRRRLGTMLT